MRAFQNPHVVRNDAIAVNAVGAPGPTAIVISPGTKTPREAGFCLQFIRRYGGGLFDGIPSPLEVMR